MQYAETPVPAGSGITERQLHQATGLRNVPFTSIISSSYGGIFTTAVGAIGRPGTPAGRSGTWPTGLRTTSSLWNPVLPVPMTPTMLFYVITSATPSGGPLPHTVEVKVRVVGNDQFGCYQEEITPWVSKVMTTTSLWFGIHLSKVFSTVDQVYVMTSNITSDGAISVCAMGWGTNIDPLMAGASAMASHSFELTWELEALGTAGGATLVTNLDMCQTFANWGIGTPCRVAPYGPNRPFPSAELLGATGTLLREKNTPTALNTTARLPVRGQLSVAGAAPVTGLCLGRSAPANAVFNGSWQGTPHKIGFFSTDGTPFTTKIAGINLGGSSTRASGIPTTEGQVGEDELMLTGVLRTMIGTSRDSNATRGYPNG